jgi:hypothetical protein
MRNPLPQLVSATVVLCMATACVTQEMPSRPSRNPHLEIRGTTLLMPGARGRLTAWLPGNGQVREVQAKWAAEGDAVSVTPNGIVTARRLGQATVRATYQDLTGAAPVQVVASVAGIWRGSITVVDCWQTVQTAPDPCDGRRGLIAPLVLNVTQNATADLYDNLRATVDVFTPPARGSFIGAVDSSGLFFLDGYVQRPDDSLSGGVRFRWQLENNQLVPFIIDGRVDDSVDVQLSVRVRATAVLINEIWKLSTMVR